MDYPSTHKFGDKAQEMLNRMARVQIEATIKANVADHILQAKAQALNAGKVKQLAYYRNQIKGEVAYSALMAALGSPPPDATRH